MNRFMLVILFNVLNFAVAFLIVVNVEDKKDQKDIASVLALTAATVHISYLCYYYGLDWVP